MFKGTFVLKLEVHGLRTTHMKRMVYLLLTHLECACVICASTLIIMSSSSLCQEVAKLSIPSAVSQPSCILNPRKKRQPAAGWEGEGCKKPNRARLLFPPGSQSRDLTSGGWICLEGEFRSFVIAFGWLRTWVFIVDLGALNRIAELITYFMSPNV